MTCRSSTPRPVTSPTATPRPSTKAQGLTVDHCYVLADDTTTREHAYTALSRGRHANHVYVVADDRRSEERHVTEIEPNALQEVRRGVSRSVAQHLAIDTGRPAHEQSALEVARRERDRLRAKLNGAQPDRTWEWQRVYNEYRSEERRRAEATRRRDGAEKDLRDLGPVGRRIHPSRRDAIQRRIEAADEAVATHDTRLADIVTQISGLTPDVQDRRTWEHRHAAATTLVSACRPRQETFIGRRVRAAATPVQPSPLSNPL